MVGCRRGPDPEKIRMYVLRSRIRDAVYIVEDEHCDLVPAVREDDILHKPFFCVLRVCCVV